MLSSCWFKISLNKVGVLHILAWFRVGLRFEHHLDDRANLLDRWIDIDIDIDVDIDVDIDIDRWMCI